MVHTRNEVINGRNACFEKAFRIMVTDIYDIDPGVIIEQDTEDSNKMSLTLLDPDAAIDAKLTDIQKGLNDLLEEIAQIHKDEIEITGEADNSTRKLTVNTDDFFETMHIQISTIPISNEAHGEIQRVLITGRGWQDTLAGTPKTNGPRNALRSPG